MSLDETSSFVSAASYASGSFCASSQSSVPFGSLFVGRATDNCLLDAVSMASNQRQQQQDDSEPKAAAVTQKAPQSTTPTSRRVRSTLPKPQRLGEGPQHRAPQHLYLPNRLMQDSEDEGLHTVSTTARISDDDEESLTAGIFHDIPTTPLLPKVSSQTRIAMTSPIPVEICTSPCHSLSLIHI